MASLLKLSFAFLLLTIFIGGVCSKKIISQGIGCNLESIRVTQTITMEHFGGKPVYEVEVSNWCNCDQSHVILRCKGFKTVEPVNPVAMKQEGEFCKINSGKPLKSGDVIKFRYAFDETFDFIPVSTEVHCH